MKKRFLLILLIVSVLMMAVGCKQGDGFTRSEVEDKLTAAGFTVISSSVGAGEINGVVIASLEGFEGTTILNIYNDEDSVPKVNLGNINYYKNVHITSSTKSVTDAVIAALQA